MSVQEQDDYDMDKLYDILENQILPMYYDDPKQWRKIVHNGMQDVRVEFDSNRMAREYYEILYK
jgi:starch phosphorylase